MESSGCASGSGSGDPQAMALDDEEMGKGKGKAGARGKGLARRRLPAESAADRAKFKEYVLGVLSSGEFDAQRSSKLDQDDFIELLARFNAAGIHFTS